MLGVLCSDVSGDGDVQKEVGNLAAKLRCLFENEGGLEKSKIIIKDKVEAVQ